MRVLPEVQKQADFLILLAFTDESTLGKLADSFFELDVILGGKVSQPSQELRKQNRSYIYFTTNESRAVGVLRLWLQNKGSHVRSLENIWSRRKQEHVNS